MALKKYFKTKKAALAELAERKKNNLSCMDEVFKMPKGTRHAGQYAVCSGLEYLNTY